MTYSIDLRKRVVEFVRQGGSKAEASRRYEVYPLGNPLGHEVSPKGFRFAYAKAHCTLVYHGYRSAMLKHIVPLSITDTAPQC